MFNLLPPNYQKALIREYRLRLATLIFWFLNATAIILAVTLLPTVLNLDFQKAELTAAAKNLENWAPELKQGQTLERQARETNQKLSALRPPSGSQPSVFLEKVLAKAGAGVQVNSINYETGEESVKMTIGGLAANRDGLLSFFRNLEAEENFKEVNLPIAHLAKDRDIKFSISLTVAR